MALTVNRCCCGCSLRTGTIIIAVYTLVCSGLLTVLSIALLCYISTDVPDGDHTYVGYDMLRVRNDPELKVALISGIVGGTVQSILNAVLLIGAYKEKKNVLIIWLVANTVIFGLSVLSFLISFFQFPVNPLFQVAAAFSIGLNLYFLLVVWSYHQSLAAGHDRKQYDANLYVTDNTVIKRMPLE